MLDPSKLKEFEDDNSKFYENGWKFSKRVENSVGKGEIGLYEQFSLSHSVFKKRFLLKTCKLIAFYATFNSISVIPRRQLTLFMLSWVSPVLV